MCEEGLDLFLEVGRVLDAVEQYQAAIGIDSAQPSAVAGLGRALQVTGNWEESLEAQRLAAELEPNTQKYQSSYLYAASLSPLNAGSRRFTTRGMGAEGRIAGCPNSGSFQRSVGHAKATRRLRVAGSAEPRHDAIPVSAAAKSSSRRVRYLFLFGDLRN